MNKKSFECGWLNGEAFRKRLTVLSVATFVLASVPVLSWYWRRLTDGSDEPLGVLALLVASGFLLAQFRDPAERAKVNLNSTRLIFGSSLLVALQVTPLRHFQLLAALVAVAVLACSVEMRRGKPGVVALLVLSLPLMASLDFYAGYPLRLAASHLAVGLLNMGGIGVELSGVLILDSGSVVGIDAPCAGVRMLWTACLTAAVVATRQRLSWRAALELFTGAVIFVVLGNGLRAALVFFPESGRIHLPEWMHQGIGLVVHGGVLAMIFLMGERLGDTRSRTGNRRREIVRVRRPAWAWGAAACVATGSVLLWPVVRGAHESNSVKVAGPWPATMDGVPLVPLPLSAREARFADAFPGSLAKFQCGDAEVILRRVASATRFLHPSSDCLRAAGFAITARPVHRDADGRVWGSSLAERGGGKWRVCERYVNAAETRVCTDASAWFWEAMLHPEEGPWTAVTVIERVGEEKAWVAGR